MNYLVYRMYAETRKIVERMDGSDDVVSDSELNMLADLKLGHVLVNEKHPDFETRYKMEQEMFASFTPEQKDFICSQIGWWYVMWKEKMWVNNKPNQHWLGTGKEDLKTMICGD